MCAFFLIKGQNILFFLSFLCVYKPSAWAGLKIILFIWFHSCAQSWKRGWWEHGGGGYRHFSTLGVLLIREHKKLVLWLNKSFEINKQRDYKLSNFFLVLFPSSLYYRIFYQGGRGQWVVYYTSPQSLIITFSYLLPTCSSH